MVFDQVVEGIEVRGAAVTILFDAATGDVLALDTSGVPFAQDVSLVPGSSASEAIAAAEAAYAAEFGVDAARVDAVDVSIVGASPFYGLKNPLNDRGPTLAYVIELSTPGYFTAQRLPAQGEVQISAEGDLTVFSVAPTAFHIDGQVNGNVNTGQEPNNANNQENPPLQNLWVRQNGANGAIIATTDANGLYDTGTSGPTNLFFELRGPYVNVINEGGADSTVTLSGATGSNNDAQFNPTKTEFPSAEVAGFYWVNSLREWIVAVDPNDDTMDFSVQTEVNKNDLLCNAYFDGNSINLERAGSGCLNTGYSDVIVHEEGHYCNAVYQGSNIAGAFHEGNADNYAYYHNDDPCLSHFNGGGGCLRSALQQNVFKCPTDGDMSCNGGASHTEGQALASACWSVRTRLGTTHGAAVGDAISDALFSAWMNAYNDKSIVNVIMDHWVALDDDDGNLSNGTPNLADIQNGFADYGWPAPADIAIAVTGAPATNAEIAHLAPVAVTADITSALGSITTVRVFYSVDGGAFTSAPMAPTGNPDEFAGQIPGVASPASVRWYVTAASTTPNNEGGVDDADLYHVGELVVLQSYDFDGAGDQGWTHVSLGGSNGDQWHRADPAGSNEATDPDAAFSPNNVWGTDLSVPGWDGKYEPNSSGELRSPSFDLSGSSAVRLQYRRWLTVEHSGFDQADIRVNGSLVYQNPNGTNLIDTDWVLHDLDITAQAANNASVQVAYRMTSDGGTEFGGWNIDDFMLYRVDPASCPNAITKSGTAEVGSHGNTALIDAANGDPQVGNNAWAVTVTGVLPNSFGVLFAGDGLNTNSVPWGDIYPSGPNFTRTVTFSDGAGDASITVPVVPAMAGTTRHFQYAFRDPGFGGNVQHSEAMSVTFCP